MKLKTCAALIGIAVAMNGEAGTVVTTGAGEYVLPVTSLRGSRFMATLRQQYDFSCGSAAVATLLTHHYGYVITEQRVFEEMFASGDQEKIRKEGFSLLDMKNFLASHGFQADGFQQPLDSLLKAGLPAIALIGERGYLHFVVLKGLRDGRVLLGDPSTGTRAMSRSNFESIWVNKLLFVIHNKQNVARFNTAQDWQAAPRAPLGVGVSHDGLQHLLMPKFGPADF